MELLAILLQEIAQSRAGISDVEQGFLGEIRLVPGIRRITFQNAARPRRMLFSVSESHGNPRSVAADRTADEITGKSCTILTNGR